jgi:hypothetical protein
MRLVCNPVRLIFLPLLLLSTAASAQDTLSPERKLLNELAERLNIPRSSFKNKDISDLCPDSLIRQRLAAAFSLPDTGLSIRDLPIFNSPARSFSSKPFLKIGSGYISYNWIYRSGNDSSVIDNNVSQHLVSGSFTATIAQTIPVRITYFERHSNSSFFKDYRDITIDIDVQRYRQLQTQKTLANLKRSYQTFQDPLLPYAKKAVDQKLDQYRDILNDPKMIKELIHSRETIIRNDYADTSAHYIDSVRSRARQFIQLYDTLQAAQARYLQMHDSLYKVYDELQKKIKGMDRLLNSKTLSVLEIEQLADVYGNSDKNIQQLRKFNSGLRKLSVGRTFPNFTALTLQNVNVNGTSLEYSKGKYYLAATAGLVDFRIRDFLYSQQKLPRQYVYAARAGYGSPESDNIILTYFRGRKQLFGGNLQRPATDIQGISLAGQFFINRNIRLYGEIAQSGVPYASGGNNNSEKPAISLNDNSQRAYALGFSSNFSHKQTTIDGYYQHSGLNYQSFNSFQYNAAANSWAFRFEQSFWKRQLVLQASFRKNDFVNPLVLQRYNTNTVFKNITVTFKKTKWPVLSVGYLPASQYTAVGNQVYENHYQTLMGNISHQYKIGTAKGGTLFSFSRFFNDSRDSGFVYYNSKNFFFGQTFLFSLFTATVNISGMDNGRHRLIVMEEGVYATFFKVINAGFAIKINNLNKIINKVGFNAKTRIALRKVGELNLWMEKSYLPGLQQELYKYKMYNMGLVRYFR